MTRRETESDAAAENATTERLAMKKATYKRTSETVYVVARHEDYAEPMNECKFADGHTGLFKDSEIELIDSTEITRVNFTWAMPGGMHVERANGARNWETFEALIHEVGELEVERLRKIAYANGMTGMWYNATNGRNVFVNGVEVN